MLLILAPAIGFSCGLNFPVNRGIEFSVKQRVRNIDYLLDWSSWIYLRSM